MIQTMFIDTHVNITQFYKRKKNYIQTRFHMHFLRYVQLSISRVQFCSSNGYLLKSIIQAAVVVILKYKHQVVLLYSQ